MNENQHKSKIKKIIGKLGDLDKNKKNKISELMRFHINEVVNSYCDNNNRLVSNISAMFDDPEEMFDDPEEMAVVAQYCTLDLLSHSIAQSIFANKDLNNISGDGGDFFIKNIINSVKENIERYKKKASKNENV